MSPADHLDAETSALQSLLALLRQEQTLLATGAADAHAALLEHKATRVAELSRLADERHRALGSMGFPASEAGMQHWLALSPDCTRAEWAALMSLARAAHETNRVNGLLLGQLQSRNRQTLAALGLGATSGLYGASGQADLALHAARPALVTG